MNGEEDRHYPKLQLHQFEEDQEWEDQSLLVLDPSPSSCQFGNLLKRKDRSKFFFIINISVILIPISFEISFALNQISIDYSSRLFVSLKFSIFISNTYSFFTYFCSFIGKRG